MHSCCASPSFHVPGNKQNQRQVYGKQVCIFQEGGHFWQSIRTSGLRRLAALERPVSKDPVTETATRIQQSKTTEQNHIQMIQMDGSVPTPVASKKHGRSVISEVWPPMGNFKALCDCCKKISVDKETCILIIVSIYVLC